MKTIAQHFAVWTARAARAEVCNRVEHAAHRIASEHDFASCDIATEDEALDARERLEQWGAPDEELGARIIDGGKASALSMIDDAAEAVAVLAFKMNSVGAAYPFGDDTFAAEVQRRVYDKTSRIVFRRTRGLGAAPSPALAEVLDAFEMMSPDGDLVFATTNADDALARIIASNRRGAKAPLVAGGVGFPLAYHEEGAPRCDARLVSLMAGAAFTLGTFAEKATDLELEAAANAFLDDEAQAAALDGFDRFTLTVENVGDAIERAEYDIDSGFDIDFEGAD